MQPGVEQALAHQQRVALVVLDEQHAGQALGHAPISLHQLGGTLRAGAGRSAPYARRTARGVDVDEVFL